MADVKCELYPSISAKGASINIYSRTDVFKLFDDNMPYVNNELYTSQFSHTITLGNSLKFSGQLVHYVLCHEVVTKKKNEMWFRVRGKLARFSIVEFAAISGLNCNDFYDVDVPECSSYSDIGISSLTYEVLVDLVEKERDANKLKRLCAMMIVAFVLLPKRRDAEVDSNVYSMSSNLEEFLIYPWGRQAFVELISSLRDLNRGRHKINNPRFGYNIFGYPLLFQVWIMETYPFLNVAIGAECSIARSIPFLTRWKTKPNAKLCRMKRIEDIARTVHASCVFPLTSDFGDLISLKFEDEDPEPVLDDYFNSLYANKSREIDFVDNVINKVLDDLPNEGGSSDDFDTPDPTKKRKSLHVVKQKVDPTNKRKSRTEISVSAKKLRLKSQGSKPPSIQKKDEVVKNAVKNVESNHSSPEDDEITLSSEYPLICGGVSSELLESNRKDDFNLGTEKEASKNEGRTTSQIMRIVKKPADADYPDWAKDLVGRFEAQEKFLKSLSNRVSENAHHLHTMSNDIKFIKEHLCGQGKSVFDEEAEKKSAKLNDIEDDKVTISSSKNDLKVDDNDEVVDDVKVLDDVEPVDSVSELHGAEETEVITKDDVSVHTKADDITEKICDESDLIKKGDDRVLIPKVDDIKKVGDESGLIIKSDDNTVKSVDDSGLMIKCDDNPDLITKVGDETGLIIKSDDNTLMTKFGDDQTNQADLKKCDKECIVDDSVVLKVDGIALMKKDDDEVDLKNSDDESRNVVKGAVNFYLRRSSRNMKDSSLIITPFTQEKKKKCPPKKPKNCFFDDDERKPLYEWLNNADDDAVVEGIEIERPKKFFKDLLKMNNWLSDDHIGDSLCFMRARIAEMKDRFKNIVVLDWVYYKYFSPNQVENIMSGKSSRQDLFSYMDGSRPRHFGKSWYYDVTIVYTPFFLVEQKHFVGLEIDLISKSIRVLDCNLGLYNDEDLVKELEPLATCLPFLMKKTDKFHHLGTFDERFQIVRDHTLPQDITGGNCGVFTIKFIEYAAFGSGFEDLEEGYIKAHREKLAIDLFNRKYVWKQVLSE